MTSLNEAIRSSEFRAASTLILKYLRKSLGQKTFLYPRPELVTISGKPIVGIRYFFGRNKSVRLNWGQTGNSISASKGLTSFDYWDGTKLYRPTTHVEIQSDVSLVKVLPLIRDFCLGKVSNSGFFLEESVDLSIVSALALSDGYKFSLDEAVITSGELSNTMSKTIDALMAGLPPTVQYQQGGNKKFGPGWNKIIDLIRTRHPEVFGKEGKKIVVNREKVSAIDAKAIIAAITGDNPDVIKFEMSAGKNETYNDEIPTEAEMDRLTYEEQLDSLKTSLRLLVTHATNAVFIAGRGGTGKTHTTEEIMAEFGFKEGSGYTKVAGSASPIGLYRLLYQNRNGVLMLDDADSALGDQEGRNLIKAAADTKKVRKISWMKASASMVDPDDYDPETMDDKLPRSFEYKGQIIFISNLSLSKLDPDGALRTRALVVDVDPTNQEIWDFFPKIIDNIPLDVDYNLKHAQRVQVVEWLRSRKMPEKTANIRILVRGLNILAGTLAGGGSVAEAEKFIKRFA